jgi:hypothetical protein
MSAAIRQATLASATLSQRVGSLSQQRLTIRVGTSVGG